jgi:hypothetical protein
MKFVQRVTYGRFVGFVCEVGSVVFLMLEATVAVYRANLTMFFLPSPGPKDAPDSFNNYSCSWYNLINSDIFQIRWVASAAIGKYFSLKEI